jgi:Nucleotidyl transferase AbiEii toxin, Type IV TA system
LNVQVNPLPYGRPLYKGLGEFIEERSERAGRPHKLCVGCRTGAVLLGEVEWKDGQANLTFADIERPRLPVYALADLFAEKLHEYTRQREQRERVKDLLDLAGPRACLQIIARS